MSQKHSWSILSTLGCNLQEKFRLKQHDFNTQVIAYRPKSNKQHYLDTFFEFAIGSNLRFKEFVVIFILKGKFRLKQHDFNTQIIAYLPTKQHYLDTF
jgi:hypothetical protein